MKLRNFIVHVMRHDNDFDELIFSAEKSKTLKSFSHRGRRYDFDVEYSFFIHEPFSLRYWLTPDRFVKYDRLMLFRESSDATDQTPIPPLTVPVSSPSIEESPNILRGVTRSPLLARYRAKQRFGGLQLSWPLLLILGVFIVVALLLVTGTISIPNLSG